MRISLIQIKNFRAFHGDKFTIHLQNGENLVIFGENGSGKSSIFNALRDFFDKGRRSANIATHPYRNFFAEEAVAKTQNALEDAEENLHRAKDGLITADLEPLAAEVKQKKVQHKAENAKYGETCVTVKFIAESEAESKNPKGRNRKLEYTWTNARNGDASSKSDAHQIAAQGIAVTSGFIDYKGLLKTYFLHPEFASVNIFDFLFHEVLAEMIASKSKKTFAGLFQEIKEELDSLESLEAAARDATDKEEMDDLLGTIANLREKIDDDLSLLNEEIKTYLAVIEPQANEFLNRFDQNLKIKLIAKDIKLANEVNEKRKLDNFDIEVKTTFHGQPQDFHHQFLNEARLSAIAVSIYLASFLVNPQAENLKILVLDDLLIGLDMANRFPVLDILEEYFADYQKFVFTFDKFWYEVLQERFPDWSHQELIALSDGAHETFKIRSQKSFFEQAKDQMKTGNYINAANLLRSYYEQIIREFCSSQNLEVRYSLHAKSEKANHFFTAIKNAPEAKRPSSSVLSRTQTVVNTILNALSHGKMPPITHSEIETAVNVLEDLKKEFGAICSKSATDTE